MQQNHQGEVEKVVNETYKELKEATKSGMNVEMATKTWEILQDAVGKLGELAKDSAGEVLDNHPEMKEKFGGVWIS